MKTNAELQKDVQDAIKWEPSLNSAEIGVTAKDGVVSLTGIVDSYAKKSEAEEAAKKKADAKAKTTERSDTVIAPEQPSPETFSSENDSDDVSTIIVYK